MGCGKSTLAHQLAFELGLATFNSDVVRKQLAGVRPRTAAPDLFRTGLYSNEMNRNTYHELERLACTELAAGHSVIIDAGFGRRSLRAEFAKLAKVNHAGFVILHVQCDASEQKRRLLERSARGDSVSDGRVELLDQQTSLFDFPDSSEENVISCSTNGPSEQALDSMYERLAWS